jgi:hypothetical protein
MGMPAPGTDPKLQREKERALGYDVPEPLDILVRSVLIVIVIVVGVLILKVL